MKKLAGVVLFLAGVGAGFCVGRFGGAGSAEKEPVALEGAPAAKSRPVRHVKAAAKKEKAAAKKEKAKPVKTVVSAEAGGGKIAAVRTPDGAEADVGSTNGVKVVLTPGADIESELKKHLGAKEFTTVTNAMANLRVKLNKRSEDRQVYLQSLDLTGASKAERDNHERYLELLAKKSAIMSRMKTGFPDNKTLQELAALEVEMSAAAKKERSMLSRELAREMGFSGEDVEVVHDAVLNIFDCTGSGALEVAASPL